MKLQFLHVGSLVLSLLSMYARLCERACKDSEGDCRGKDLVLPICCAFGCRIARCVPASMHVKLMLLYDLHIQLLSYATVR